MFCKFCGRQVDAEARFCPYCGQTLIPDAASGPDPSSAAYPQGAYPSQGTYPPAPQMPQTSYPQTPYPQPVRVVSRKSKVTAILLAFFLGGFGAHKLYLKGRGWA